MRNKPPPPHQEKSTLRPDFLGIKKRAATPHQSEDSGPTKKPLPAPVCAIAARLSANYPPEENLMLTFRTQKHLLMSLPATSGISQRWRGLLTPRFQIKSPITMNKPYPACWIYIHTQ